MKYGLLFNGMSLLSLLSLPIEVTEVVETLLTVLMSLGGRSDRDRKGKVVRYIADNAVGRYRPGSPRITQARATRVGVTRA